MNKGPIPGRPRRRTIQHQDEVLGWMDEGMTPSRAAAEYERKWRERFSPEAFNVFYKRHRELSPIQKRVPNPYLAMWDMGDHSTEHYPSMIRSAWRQERGLPIPAEREAGLRSLRKYLDGENEYGLKLVIDFQPWDPNVFVFVERVDGDSAWTHCPQPGERKRVGPKTRRSH